MVTTQPGQGDAHANVDRIGDAFQLLQLLYAPGPVRFKRYLSKELKLSCIDS
jgi:hypothetical protein